MFLWYLVLCILSFTPVLLPLIFVCSLVLFWFTQCTDVLYMYVLLLHRKADF
jgi:hypothetical protein